MLLLPKKIIAFDQDWANNSTPLRYSKKKSLICELFVYEPSKKDPELFEYLYFRRIWQILVESSQIEPSYLCFRPYIVSWRINKLLLQHNLYTGTKRAFVSLAPFFF